MSGEIDDNKLNDFLKELTDLSKKHGIVISGAECVGIAFEPIGGRDSHPNGLYVYEDYPAFIEWKNP